ncbi:RWD domain-containing protein 3-like [Ptychodera flava]|uniref:RWD domain-containing protein 3-like n=1 Tax=Ptychodera flava TaxID=63121 RepID=UPI00396A5384
MAGTEVEALMAIYCSEGEFTLQNATENRDTGQEISFSLCITCEKVQDDHRDCIETQDFVKVTLSITLPVEYPKVLPMISVSCEKLTRQQTGQLRSDLLEYAQSLVNEYMIMDLIMWVKQHIWMYITTSDGDKTEASTLKEPTCLALLHIDHMRSAQKYIKIIASWAKELDLSGRLLIQGNLILLILQGLRSAIKEYVRRQRTQKVDVDSHGRSCKEKMLSVLCEEPLPSHVTRCQSFEIRKLESGVELEDEFKDLGLMDHYRDYVAKMNHS